MQGPTARHDRGKVPLIGRKRRGGGPPLSDGFGEQTQQLGRVGIKGGELAAGLRRCICAARAGDGGIGMPLSRLCIRQRRLSAWQQTLQPFNIRADQRQRRTVIGALVASGTTRHNPGTFRRQRSDTALYFFMVSLRNANGSSRGAGSAIGLFDRLGKDFQIIHGALHFEKLATGSGK